MIVFCLWFFIIILFICTSIWNHFFLNQNASKKSVHACNYQILHVNDLTVFICYINLKLDFKNNCTLNELKKPQPWFEQFFQQFKLTSSNGCLSGFYFIPHFPYNLWWRTNESDPCIQHLLCKIISLWQEAIARMYGINTVFLETGIHVCVLYS